MNTNNKGISTVLAAIIIIGIIVAVVAVAFSLGSTPAESNNVVTVYIDDIQQTGNYSEPQTLDWGSTSAGNTYTKNFNVSNPTANAYTLLLLTTEPAGTTQTWIYNNTALAANSYAAGSLTLSLSTAPSSGAYTWRLLATNSTTASPTPTPTAGPTATPIPNSITFTIDADSNVLSIALSVNNAAAYPITDFPQTFTCTPGDDLKLTPTYAADYILAGWLFGDGSIPKTTSILTINNVDSNFTVTCTSQYMPSPTTVP